MQPHRPWTAFAIVIALTIAATSSSPGAAGVKLTNKLATAASPYLREAARQPVAWYPWGEEPFRLAKQLDRPVLLDIGAIWCHWCHVMDEETYSNPELARLINDNFIAIKVDRDERPDIDSRYQKAVHALTGAGGWPLTVFLNAGGQAFYGGGTFFPDDQYGRIGFRTLLPRIALVYRQRREAVQSTAEKVQQALAEAQDKALQSADVSPRLVEGTTQGMLDSFDSTHGGFGQGAKFPMGSPLELAFRLYAERGDTHLLQLATRTLDATANGGIRDHLGGGFHRYATDPAWEVPHFEILDYVQAQLLLAYLLAYQATQQARYREVAEGILSYVTRLLSDQVQGGFYAHQDADMGPGDDGAYYTWTIPEVRGALPKAGAEVIIRYYGLTEQGDMPATPGRNVLRIVTTPEAIAREFSLPSAKVQTFLASGRKRLQEVRGRRRMPLVDRTRYADRNGMMISAYFEAYKVLGREDLKAFAVRSLEFLLTHLRSGDGRLSHAFSESKAHVPGFLNDYVWVAEACLQAFQVTGERRYLAMAREVMDQALRTFWDGAGGGFFDLRPEPTALGPLRRPAKSFEDTDLPSPNAVAAQVLDQLAYLTNVPLYRERAEQLLRAFAGTAPQYGRYAAGYALAVDLHLHPPAHAVIIGARSDSRTQALWHAALAAFRPGKIIAAYDPALVAPTELPPPVAAAMRTTRAAGLPQAYVCVGTVCSLPTAEPKEVGTLVSTFETARSSARSP